MKIEKTCIVCGKPFTAANPLYCLCSDECRAKRKAVYSKNYRKVHAETISAQRRKYYEKYHQKKKYRCKICGAELPNGSQKYCLNCLLKAYQISVTHSWAAGVLYCRGYDKTMIDSKIAERASR